MPRPKKTKIVTAPKVETDVISKADKSVFDDSPHKVGYKRETMSGPKTNRRFEFVGLPYGNSYSKFGEYYQMNTYLADCVDVISEYSTMEYSIDETEGTKKAPKKKQLLTEFYESAGRFKPFTEVLQEMVMDWKAKGNGVQELVLTKENVPQNVYNHNSAYVTVRRDKLMYKITYGIKSYYLLPWYIDPKDEVQGMGITYDEYFRVVLKDPHYMRKDFSPHSRMIHFKTPHPNNDFYGHSPAETCLRAIIGYAESGDYNIMWFENQGFGDWSVVITPNAPDNVEIEWDEKEMDEFEKKIKSFFYDTGKRGPGRVMFIRAPNQYVKAEMKQLNTSLKEGHFRLYRKDSRDEIIQRYRVPGILIGVGESGGLTGQWKEQVQVFKDTVITPLQSKVEWTYYMIIKKYFDIVEYEMKLRRLDVDTELDKITSLRTMSEMFVGTPREIGNMLNVEIPEGAEWGDIPVAALRLLLNPQTAEKLGFGIEFDNADLKFFDDLKKEFDKVRQNGEGNELDEEVDDNSEPAGQTE